MYRHHPILKQWHRCENDIKYTPEKLHDYSVPINELMQDGYWTTKTYTELKTFTASFSDCKNW